MNIEDDPRFTAYALDELGAAERDIFIQDLSNAGGARHHLEEIRECARRIRDAFAAEPVYALSTEQRGVLLAESDAFAEPLMVVGDEIAHTDRILPWVTQPVISEVDKQAIAERLRPSAWRRIAPVLGSLGVAAGLMWLLAIVVTHRPNSRSGSPAIAEDEVITDPITIVHQPDLRTPRGPRFAGMRPELMAPLRYPDPGIGGAPISPDEGFRDPLLADQRRSALPVVIGLESYEALRQFMGASMLPPADSIRIAELINAFEYQYAPPLKGESFAVATELADCPWTPGHQLLQVGVRAAGGEEGDATTPVAEGVQMAIEFNPSNVAAYRLIGESELADPNNPAAAGEGVPVEGGHTVTALYELVPRADAGADAGESSPGEEPATEELATVRVEYREPAAGPAAGTPDSVEASVKRVANARVGDASEDFRHVASVAGFGLLLGAEEGKRLPTYDLVLQLARDAVGDDPDGKRAEFVSWIEKTIELKGEEAGKKE